MKSITKDGILDFNYNPLVDDIYQCIDDESYEESYNIVKNKNDTNINEKITQFRTYKTKVMIVIMMILNFINSLFVRICGYIVITSIVGFIHSFINAKSFLYISQLGQNIYDNFLQHIFTLTSKEIIVEGSKGMISQSANSPMTQSSSYLLFYIIIGTLVLLSVWFVRFIYKMIKTEEVNFVEKVISLDEALHKLGCNEFDDFNYIKKQLNKKYLKNQISRNSQLIYVQSYVTIIKNKDFSLNDEELNKNEQNRLLRKMLLSGSIYFLNLISKAIFISGIFIVIYYRFVDFFVNRGYLENLWKFFTDIHLVVQGGIIAWVPIYRQVTEHIQITISVTFVVMCVLILLQCRTLFIQPLKRLQCNYRNYLILNRNKETIEKFKDSYSFHWFILMIIIGMFGLLTIVL